MTHRSAIVILLASAPPSLAPAQAAIEFSFPGERWERADPEDVGLDAESLAKARDHALSGGGSGCVVRHGRLVLAWGDQERTYDLKSSSKSIGVTALGLAIADRKMRLDDLASKYHPRFGVPPEGNAQTGWLERITLRHLAAQTAGFAKPGGYEPLLFEPGTRWHYSDGGPNWLAECVTLAYRRDIESLLFERVFDVIGVRRADLRWRKHAYRERTIDGGDDGDDKKIERFEFGSGVHANVQAMARLGCLYLREGEWKGRQILPKEFVRAASSTVEGVVGLPEHDEDAHGNASDHYGLLWWNNRDGTLAKVPRDTYWSWGLHDSLIVVVPSLDLVVARAGRSWERTSDAHYDVLKPFFEPLVEAAGDRGQSSESARSAPYPASPVIRVAMWAPASKIVRQAKGGDNWPLTWGDDDALYTAWGDGHGFEPRTREKLSLGVARVTGTPEDFRGENISAPSVEAKGDGRAGRKASGILMIDGVLYLLARNTGNAHLAVSKDRGRTWTWADWRFEESFGCPTFLNFGRDHAGARDEFVYVYSHDADSAYEPADRMVLARAPRDRLLDRSVWRFFAGLDTHREPSWSSDVAERAAVFENTGRCYRSSVTYSKGLDRYLWCQTIPGGDTRFTGGFGIYDAPAPWGPWTTVYLTESWDVGPGETSSLPTKWMSEDGLVAHLVFSGDDAFSVRRVEFARVR